MNVKEGLRILSGIGASILLVFLIYSSWQWTFRKPQPIIQNTYQNTTVMPGANMTQTNDYVKQEAKDRRFFTGIYGSKNEIGGVIGWLW